MNIHIVSEGDQWVILQEGQAGEHSRHPSKAEAVKAGLDLAKQTIGEVDRPRRK